MRFIFLRAAEISRAQTRAARLYQPGLPACHEPLACDYPYDSYLATRGCRAARHLRANCAPAGSAPGKVDGTDRPVFGIMQSP